MLWKKELDHQKDGLVMKINEADLMVTNDEDDEYDEYENDENLNEQINHNLCSMQNKSRLEGNHI